MSSNNGWQAFKLPAIGTPIDLAISNTDVCYIISISTTPFLHNVLTKTFDGGITWSQIHYSKTAYSDTSIGTLLNIYASPFNPNNIFVSRSNLLRSINGGYNYQNVDTANKLGTPLMYFFDQKNGFSAGSSISKTVDSGLNWNQIYASPLFMSGFQYLEFPSVSVGYAAGGTTHDASNFGYIVKTMDGGTSWKAINLPHNLTGIHFISPSTGFCAINLDSASIATTYRRGCALYKTSDYGEHWTLVNNSIYERYGAYAENLYFKNEQEGYFSSWVGIFSTIDGGLNWQREIPNSIYKMRVVQNTAYAVDSAGVILKKYF